MSLEQIAYLQREVVPDRVVLQTSINALGFPCKLGPTYSPFESSGFLPCSLEGLSTGFEIGFHATAELELPPKVAEAVAQRDTAIVFRWGGSMQEAACALIVCAALAKDFGAVVHYPEDDLWYSASELQVEAASALQFTRQLGS